MKNIKICLLVVVACMYSVQASAYRYNKLTSSTERITERIVASLHEDAAHVATTLEAKANFSSSQGIKLAAVCALGSGGCDGLGFGTGNNDIDLDNNAQCRDDGFDTSCPSGSVPDTSQVCPYNGSFFKCRACSNTCSTGSLTTCNSEQIQTGTNKNDCGETCYTCREKTCEEGGYNSSLTSCQKANAVSFAGKTCYNNITTKTCADGGYATSIPANQVGESTSFCGNTCYYNFRTPSCSEGGYSDNVPVNQVCSSTTYYGQSCYSGCYTPGCSNGGYVDSCPTNQIGTSVNYYGQNCYKDCVNVCTPIDCSGYNLGSCPANGTCSICTVGCDDYSPKYKLTGCQAGYIQNGDSCRAESCADGGYLDSCSINQIGTPIPHNGKTCYKDCQSSICEVGSFLYYDTKCSKDIIPGMTPVGIIFSSADGFLAINAENPIKYAWGGAGFYTAGIRYCRDNPRQCGMPEGGLNTHQIIAFGQANGLDHPAVEYCYNYPRVDPKSGVDKWYLPSITELEILRSAKSVVNTKLQMLGKKALAKGYYWSSDIKDYDDAWTFDVGAEYDSNAMYKGMNKNTENYVVPVLRLDI